MTSTTATLMLLAVLLGLACHASPPAVCPEQRQQAILGGDPRWPLADEGQAGALVRIDVVRGGQVVDLCTGTFVAAGWVVTARHCVAALDPAGLRVVTGEGARLAPPEPAGACVPDGPDRHAGAFPVLGIHQHPELDLALLRVAATSPVPAIHPLTADVPLAPLAGPLFVAGYGLDEAASPGIRRFAPATLEEEAGGFAYVHVEGQGGACFGDSGGPLLLDQGGVATVAGVLNIGSGDCLGSDRYQLLAPASEWLATFWELDEPARPAPR
jgi:Trypsin